MRDSRLFSIWLTRVQATSFVFNTLVKLSFYLFCTSKKKTMPCEKLVSFNISSQSKQQQKKKPKRNKRKKKQINYQSILQNMTKWNLKRSTPTKERSKYFTSVSNLCIIVDHKALTIVHISSVEKRSVQPSCLLSAVLMENWHQVTITTRIIITVLTCLRTFIHSVDQ